MLRGDLSSGARAALRAMSASPAGVVRALVNAARYARAGTGWSGAP